MSQESSGQLLLPRPQQPKPQSSFRMASLVAVMALSKVFMDTIILSRLDLESRALLSTLNVITLFATVPPKKMMDTLVYCLKESKDSALTDQMKQNKSQSIYVTAQYVSLFSGLFSSLSINLSYRLFLSSYSLDQENKVSQFLLWSMLPNVIEVVTSVDQNYFQYHESGLAPALFVLGQVARWGGLAILQRQLPQQSDLLSMVQGYFIASVLTWLMFTVVLHGCRPLVSQRESRYGMFFNYRQFDIKTAKVLFKKGLFEYGRMVLDIVASLFLVNYLKKKMTNQAVAMLAVLNSLAMWPVALLGVSLELALTKYPKKLFAASIGVFFSYVLLGIGVMSNNLIKKPIFSLLNVTAIQLNNRTATDGDQWQQANQALLFTIIYSCSLSLKLSVAGRLRSEGGSNLSCLASILVLTMVAVSTQFGLNSVAEYFETFTVANLAASLLMLGFLKYYPSQAHQQADNRDEQSPLPSVVSTNP